jgi:hypothetical protein
MESPCATRHGEAYGAARIGASTFLSQTDRLSKVQCIRSRDLGFLVRPIASPRISHFLVPLD